MFQGIPPLSSSFLLFSRMRDLSQADPARQAPRLCDRSMASGELPGLVFSNSGIGSDISGQETPEAAPSLAPTS